MKVKRFKLITITALVALLIALCAVAVIPSSTKASAATLNSYTLSSDKYEFVDNTGYKFESANKKTSYPNGLSKLGNLTVSGEDLTVTTYNGVQAIGINKGTSLTFTYKQSISSSITYGGHTWMLGSDSATEIAGYSVGTIGSGAIIILSSKDGSNWSTTGSRMVEINDKTFTFAPSGTELKESRYYRFLSVAETHYAYKIGSHKEYPNGWCKFWGCHGYYVDDYSNYYTNLGQMTTVYVCPNNPEVSFTSKATANYEFNSEAELTDEDVAFLRQGATLTDGGVSFSSITVNDLGNTCFKIYLSYNGEDEKSISSGTTFSQEGQYVFRVRTPLGAEKKTTLYIVNSGDDLGFSNYFAEGIIDGTKRMLNTTKAVPVYMVGKEYTIAPQSEWLPGLYGELWYFRDETAVENEDGDLVQEFKGLREMFHGQFDKQGYWIFNLFSSDPNVSGTEIVNYSFRIYTWDNPEYAPTVNYDLLTSTARNDLFSRRVYAVSLPTAGGGMFVYCFPHTSEYYDLALSTAEQIELLSVEEYEDMNGKYYYYKSRTSNTKEKYLSKSKFFEAIAYFAQKNVDTLYLEADTEYLTRSADEDTLKDLTKQSISKDVCVVLNESIKKELQAPEIYLNGFKFISVADYESYVVMACDENGNQFYIPYGTDMEEVFNETTQVRIAEVNWNKQRVYEAIYYKPGDNFGEILLNLSGEQQTFNQFSTDTITGFNVSIVSAGDDFDSQSMLSITDSKGERTVMLLSEAAGYGFGEGRYTLKITNRFGTSYALELEVTAVPDVDVPVQSETPGTFKSELSDENPSTEEPIVEDVSSFGDGSVTEDAEVNSSAQNNETAMKSTTNALATQKKGLSNGHWALIGIAIILAVGLTAVGVIFIVRKVRRYY